MKEPFSFEPGRVVQSIQGRDRGKYFLILERPEEQLVLIAIICFAPIMNTRLPSTRKVIRKC